MLPIKQQTIKYNFSVRNGSKIEYVVIHNTSNDDKGANAQAHYNYFNGGDRNASADFFVDDHEIVQLIDFTKNYSWAVGDGQGTYGITNKNSVSIEICENADGNYDQAVSNAVELAVYLLGKLGLGIDRLKRHYDASRKDCPHKFNNNGDWSAWNKFVGRVNTLLNPVKQVETQLTAYSRGYSGEGVKDIQNKLNEIGYNCGIADGVFGSLTYNAVLAFQRAQKLDVDGIVGKNTMAAMNKAVEEKKKLIEQYGEVTVSILNVRYDRNSSSKTIGTLKKGTKVRIDKKMGDWYSIYFGSHGGFVFAQYIKLI